MELFSIRIQRTFQLVSTVLGVQADGIVGPKTLQAVNNADSRTLFDTIKAEREAFLYRIVERDPSQKRFIKGWLNRLNALKYSV